MHMSFPLLLFWKIERSEELSKLWENAFERNFSSLVWFWVHPFSLYKECLECY